MSGDYTAGAALPAGELTSGDLAAETTARTAADATLIPKSVVTTKGDLLAATASATVARVPVGADGLALVGDTASAAGVKFGAVTEVHLISPDATVYRVKVANDGTLSSEVVV